MSSIFFRYGYALQEPHIWRAVKAAEGWPASGRGRPRGRHHAAGIAAWLNAAQLEQACRHAAGLKKGPYSLRAQDAVAEILCRVGPAGERARSDEERYFNSFEHEQYSSKAHKGRDWREVSFAAVSTDFSRAIICYANVGSYLHIPSAVGGLHHLRFDVYLVVRDATSSARHILRIPPRFGRYTSATVKRLANSDDLTQAAVAWTFDVRPEEYAPQLVA